jgi:hypothetical protein
MCNTHVYKCCLTGKLPQVARARLLHEIELHVTAASKRARATTLGLLSLVRWAIANTCVAQQGKTVERLLAGTLMISELPLWNERLNFQLMLRIATRGLHKTATWASTSGG